MKKKNSSGFFGGIHPSDGTDKELTRGQGICRYTPRTVEIFMQQTPGGSSRLLVEEGEVVQKGQVIAEAATFLTAPVHASVTGQVVEIRQDERGIQSCVIKVSQEAGEEEPADYQIGWQDTKEFSKEEILQLLKEGGIVGLGGAGFPTHIKYETDKPIDTLIINAAECEPYLTCDHLLMLTEGMAVLNGVNILMKASGASQAFLCLEDNKADAADYLQGLLSEEETDIRIKTLPTLYPQGGERQLIQAVLKREVPMGGLPADVGVIVSNVATAKAAADMIFNKKPLTERIVTITGMVERPCNYLVPIGTRFRDLLVKSGDVSSGRNRVILGGPMTGTCIAVDTRAERVKGSVTKVTSGLVILPPIDRKESPCIRCGACHRVCPAGLNPFKIDFAYRQGDIELCRKLYATECIGCGSCSYVCPAHIELAFRNIAARNTVRQQLREKGVIR